jgi:hypothetical protein
MKLQKRGLLGLNQRSVFVFVVDQIRGGEYVKISGSKDKHGDGLRQLHEHGKDTTDTIVRPQEIRSLTPFVPLGPNAFYLIRFF